MPAVEVNYYALLSDGSTDKGVVEEEVIYVFVFKKEWESSSSIPKH